MKTLSRHRLCLCGSVIRSLLLAPALVPLTIAFASPVTTALAQSPEQQERIQASFVLSLGRPPTATELATWLAPGEIPLSALVTRQREQLHNNADLRRTTLVKACVDAFGREPTESEINSWTSNAGTYTEHMKRHLAWLASHPVEYEQVIERAYQRTMSRSAYPGEYAYWKQRATLSYALLVGCIEEWGRRNSPGLMETTGTASVSINSRFLTAIMLSPAVAAEARETFGLPAEGEAALAIAAGRNLIAAGGADIVTNGHMHLVVAGSPNLLPARRGS